MGDVGISACGHVVWELGMALMGRRACLWGLQRVWIAGDGEGVDGWWATWTDARGTSGCWKQETETSCINNGTLIVEDQALYEFDFYNRCMTMPFPQSRTLSHPYWHLLRAHEYVPTPLRSAIVPSF